MPISDYLLTAVVTLFVTIDPAGLVPVFIVLTAGRTRNERAAISLRAVVIAGAVLVGFAIVGEPLIGVLGISLPAFRISGGLLLFAIAFEMLFDLRGARKSATAQSAVAGEDMPQHVAVFPLAIPLITGPGAISATILLASKSHNAGARIGLIIVIVALLGVCYAVFQIANQIDRILGETGRNVVTRLLGLLLAALSVQFVAEGIFAFIRSPPAGIV